MAFDGHVYDCGNCSQQQKKFWGCGNPDKRRYAVIDGEDVMGCPMEIIGPQELTLIDMYKHYKAGFLLCDGGLNNQPAAYVEAMGIIDSAVSEQQRKKQEQMRQSNGVK